MHRILFCLVYLLLFCIFFCHFAHAQGGTGGITGSVQDSAGANLVSAKVKVEPGDRQVPSDNQGQFRIPNLPPGQYTLTATYVGFKPYTATVTVSDGQTASVTATLQVLSQADSVLVTAPRLQGDAEAVNVERVSAQIVQVEPQGVITSLPNTNVADAIGRLPSVSLERDEGEGKYVQIRDTEPRLNNLTINGVMSLPWKLPCAMGRGQEVWFSVGRKLGPDQPRHRRPRTQPDLRNAARWSY